MARTYSSLCFEDVAIGQQLPPLHMTITITRAMMAASANRDWQRLHHDRDFAQTEAGTRDIALGLWFYMGMFSRVITDWAGPESVLRSLEFDMLTQLCPGDEMHIESEVVALRVDENEHIADLSLRLSNQLGLIVPATASVVLPTRASVRD